ncbi:unnamed protein product [Eretmochelys imbricata]
MGWRTKERRKKPRSASEPMCLKTHSLVATVTAKMRTTQVKGNKARPVSRAVGRVPLSLSPSLSFISIWRQFGDWKSLVRALGSEGPAQEGGRNLVHDCIFLSYHSFLILGGGDPDSQEQALNPRAP